MKCYSMKRNALEYNRAYALSYRFFAYLTVSVCVFTFFMVLDWVAR